MKKLELLAELEANEWVAYLVGEPVLKLLSQEAIDRGTSEPNGDNWYQQQVCEVNGNIGEFRLVNFYVHNEGKEDEIAFYKQSKPAPTLLKEMTDAEKFEEAVVDRVRQMTIEKQAQSRVV